MPEYRAHGRNEAFFHAGNVVSAGIAAILAWFWGPVGVFYGVAGMALASAVCAQRIRETDIDHELARGADAEPGAHRLKPLASVLSSRRLLWFTAAVVMFHFANAAMLPLLGQTLASTHRDSASTLMAACIIVAQLAMVPVAILASRRAVFGRRRVLLVGFAVLPVRGFLYTLTNSPSLLIANQVLDGIGAGIFGVVALLVVADLTKGTGHYNGAIGFVFTAVGMGAACSNVLTGLIVNVSGYRAGFLFLTSVAVAAFVVLFTTFQESLPPPAPETGTPPDSTGKAPVTANSARPGEMSAGANVVSIAPTTYFIHTVLQAMRPRQRMEDFDRMRHRTDAIGNSTGHQIFDASLSTPM